MVTGMLRAVLWILGSLAVGWLVLALFALPSMARMMGRGGMMQGGMMEGGMMGGGMMGMMGMMALQTVAMLGLVGIFIYLVVDSIRSRR
ncbi:MAG: hypothetical protein M3P24_12100 [Gemmatimonadota bacterium]|nr:hypothetical protein [Gemmatimonadota bacterium]